MGFTHSVRRQGGHGTRQEIGDIDPGEEPHRHDIQQRDTPQPQQQAQRQHGEQQQLQVVVQQRHRHPALAHQPVQQQAAEPEHAVARQCERQQNPERGANMPRRDDERGWLRTHADGISLLHGNAAKRRQRLKRSG
jgi:hypothetical protein